MTHVVITLSAVLALRMSMTDLREEAVERMRHATELVNQTRAVHSFWAQGLVEEKDAIEDVHRLNGAFADETREIAELFEQFLRSRGLAEQ
jgi:hypothetical protein